MTTNKQTADRYDDIAKRIKEAAEAKYQDELAAHAECAGELYAMHKDRDDAISALRALFLEVSGFINAWECEIVAIVGKTNIDSIRARLANARALIYNKE